jgi:hypothetical protein
MTEEARLTLPDRAPRNERIKSAKQSPEAPDEEERHSRDARRHGEDVRAPETLLEQKRFEHKHVDRRGVL